MAWPVNMRYTKEHHDDEVTLTVTDAGAVNAMNVREKRVLLRRLYKNTDAAFSALVAHNNQLAAAMWSCYGVGSGYEIGDISITVGDTQFGCIDDYEDEEGNLKLDEYFDTGTTLDDFKQAFEFRGTDVLTARSYIEHTYSKDAIVAAANEVTSKWLHKEAVLFKEFSDYIETTGGTTKSVDEIVQYLFECGELDAAYEIE